MLRSDCPIYISLINAAHINEMYHYQFDSLNIMMEKINKILLMNITLCGVPDLFHAKIVNNFYVYIVDTLSHLSAFFISY